MLTYVGGVRPFEIRKENESTPGIGVFVDNPLRLAFAKSIRFGQCTRHRSKVVTGSVNLLIQNVVDPLDLFRWNAFDEGLCDHLVRLLGLHDHVEVLVRVLRYVRLRRRVDQVDLCTSTRASKHSSASPTRGFLGAPYLVRFDLAGHVSLESAVNVVDQDLVQGEACEQSIQPSSVHRCSLNDQHCRLFVAVALEDSQESELRVRSLEHLDDVKVAQTH